MGLVLHVEPRRCWTELTLERRFEGWDGIAHGGILCTILDEVMAWSLVGEDNWGLTARMNVEFKKPVEIGQPIRAEGWITQIPPPARRHRRPDRGPAHGRRVSPPRPASTWPPTRPASASFAQRYGYVPLGRDADRAGDAAR